MSQTKISIPELKQRIADLDSSGWALADVLARVRDEGRRIDPSGKAVNWQWVEQALTNILTYEKELSDGLRARDPIVIRHSAGRFFGILKYFEDTPLEWSNLEKDLRQKVSQTADRGAKVASVINPFDPANVAEIQRSL